MKEELRETNRAKKRAEPHTHTRKYERYFVVQCLKRMCFNFFSTCRDFRLYMKYPLPVEYPLGKPNTSKNATCGLYSLHKFTEIQIFWIYVHLNCNCVCMSRNEHNMCNQHFWKSPLLYFTFNISVHAYLAMKLQI